MKGQSTKRMTARTLRAAKAATARPITSLPEERATRRKEEKKPVAIHFTPLSVGSIKITVAAKSPLIMNAWSAKAIKMIEDKQTGRAPGVNRKDKTLSRPAREFRDPRAEWHASRYIDEKGRDCIPTIHFKYAMMIGAPYLGMLPKLVREGIFIVGDLIPIKFKGKEPVMRTDMVRTAGIKPVAMPRYRPEYRDWSCEVTIEFDESVFTPEIVVNLINRGGFNGGVGEWRPSSRRPGPFGRFTVVGTK